jgi:transcriptional regulator
VHNSKTFRVADNAAIARHINRIRFGTLVAHGVDRFDASPLPWVAEHGTEGMVLWGHLANANSQLEMLRRQPRAMIVFNGENGYITPRGLPTPKSAPTWNYIAIHLEGDCELLDAATTEEAVERLVLHLEKDRVEPWSTSEMGDRRERLLRFVTGIRMRPRRVDAKFKLGQNERLDDLKAILANLEVEGHDRLAQSMRDANAQRLAGKTP